MARESGQRKYDVVEHARDVYTPEEIRAFKQGGYWVDKLLVDYLEFNACTYPAKVAVVDRDKRVSWAELNARANRIAAGLIGLGLSKGDYVGLQLPNWVEFLEVFLGLQKAGLRAVIMQSIYRARDVSYMLNKCKAKGIVIPDRFRGFDHVAMVEGIRGEIPSLAHTIVVGEPGIGMLSLATLKEHPDAGDAALFVEADLGFWKIQRERTVLEAQATNLLREFMSVVQHALDGIVRRRLLQNGEHFFVGEAALRVDNGGIKLGAQHAAIVGDEKLHALGQAIHVGLQRAEFITQGFGQHRDDAVHEVGGVAALARLDIQGGAGLHVIRYVRDVNPELPLTLRRSFQTDRIVEILRVVRINGDDLM